MNINSGMRRFVAGSLVAASALSLLACGRGNKNEQTADPLGYYLPTEYGNMANGLRESYNSDPATASVQTSIRTNQPIPIRLLMDMVFNDHGQYFLARPHLLPPGQKPSDKIWEEVSKLSASINYSGVVIGRLKDMMEDRLRSRGHFQYDVSRADSSSIASRLIENRGNAYSTAMLLDMVLRLRLGAAYPAERLVMVFTDGQMELAEVQNGNLFRFTGASRLVQNADPIDRAQPMRVVSTNDFLFAEAMRNQIAQPEVIVNHAVSHMTGRYHFEDGMPGQFHRVPDLNNSIFGWSTHARHGRVIVGQGGGPRSMGPAPGQGPSAIVIPQQQQQPPMMPPQQGGPVMMPPAQQGPVQPPPFYDPRIGHMPQNPQGNFGQDGRVLGPPVMGQDGRPMRINPQGNHVPPRGQDGRPLRMAPQSQPPNAGMVRRPAPGQVLTAPGFDPEEHDEERP